MLSVEAEEDVAVTLGLILFLVYLVGQYFYPGAGYVGLIEEDQVLTALYVTGPPAIATFFFFLSSNFEGDDFSGMTKKDLVLRTVLSLVFLAVMGVIILLAMWLVLFVIALAFLPLAFLSPLAIPYLLYKGLDLRTNLKRRYSIVLSLVSLILLILIYFLNPLGEFFVVIGVAWVAMIPVSMLFIALLGPWLGIKLDVVKNRDAKLLLLIALPSVIYASTIGYVAGVSLSGGLGFGKFSLLLFFFSVFGIVLGLFSTLTGAAFGYIEARSLTWFLRRVDRYF